MNTHREGALKAWETMRTPQWRSTHNPPYPKPKDHEMSDADKAAVSSRIEQIEDRGRHADVHKLAATYHCSPSQIAGIKAALHRVAVVALAILSIATAYADERRHNHKREHEPNWILYRQEGYQEQGVPTSRIIVGRREIDIYPNGHAWEKGGRVR